MEQFGGRAQRADQLRNLLLGHALLLQGFHPQGPVVIHRNTQNGKVVGVVAPVQFFERRNFRAAGSTPTGPEINQQVLALEVLQRRGLSGGIGLGERGGDAARLGLVQGRDALPHGLARRAHLYGRGQPVVERSQFFVGRRFGGVVLQ